MWDGKLSSLPEMKAVRDKVRKEEKKIMLYVCARSDLLQDKRQTIFMRVWESVLRRKDLSETLKGKRLIIIYIHHSNCTLV